MSDIASEATLASGVDATIAGAGYVKLLVRLAPDAAREAAAPGGSVADLAANFLIPSEEQAASLSAVAARAMGARRSRPAPPAMRFYPHLGLALGYVDAAGVAALRQDNRVQAVAQAPELSLIRPKRVAAATAAGPKVSWGLERLRVPQAWAAGYDGTGVLVGHLDTGVDGDHPAFLGAIAHYALVDQAGNLVPGARPSDSDEHGTHTAGTILGRPVRGRAFGVAPGARLVSAQVIEGGQVIDRVLEGMDWALSKRIRVLSLSLGLRGFTAAFSVLIDALRAGGALPVVAVGNEGPGTSRSPGNYGTVLSVGAMDENDRVADFSGSQRFTRPKDALVPDLVAPGVNIRSALPGGGFGVMDGSSMATPHVAGLAALLFQAKPDATVAAVEQAILASCIRPSGMPEGRANRGVPDAVRAIEALTGLTLPTAPKPKPKPKTKRVAKPSASRPPVAGRAKTPAKRAAAGRTKAPAKRPTRTSARR
jgi:subtilisin